MDNKCLLPQESLDKLKCYFCKNYLSVGPTLTVSLDGKLFKCGRCYDIKTEYNIRNICFENVAPFLQFPCIYKDCEEKLTWNAVQEHEKVCEHRTLQCVRWNCNAIVKIQDFKLHFEKNHECSLFSNEVHYDLILNHRSVFVMFPFVILLSISQSILKLGVFSIETLPIKHKFQATLKRTCDDESPVILFCGDVIEYDERYYCFRCMFQKCQLSWHKYSEKHHESGENTKYLQVNISLEGINMLLNPTEKIHFTVTVTNTEKINSNHETEVENELTTNKVNTELDSIVKAREKQFLDALIGINKKYLNILRNAMECPICHEYMIPPIHSCTLGHTICNSCKEKIERCPTCNEVIDKTREFALEDISQNLELPCQYTEGGCKLSGNIEMIRVHESDCPFST